MWIFCHLFYYLLFSEGSWQRGHFDKQVAGPTSSYKSAALLGSFKGKSNRWNESTPTIRMKFSSLTW